MKTLPSRDILGNRHRLSHQQIDMLLGENEAPKHLTEKINGLKMVHNFLHLIDFLNEHNVDFLNLKGPLLSNLIYSDATIRISKDFDILIAPNDIDNINQLLLNNGFKLKDNTSWPKEKKKQQMLSTLTHHLAYMHSELGYLTEIHWTLNLNSPLSHHKMNSLVIANTKTYMLNGRKVKSLNEEMLLAYLIIHGTLHGWQRLKWLVDIKDFPDNLISKEKFEQIAKVLRIERAIAQTGILLNHYFGDCPNWINMQKVPEYLINYNIEIIATPISGESPMSQIIKDIGYRFFIFKGIRYKQKVISSLLIQEPDLNKINSDNKLFFILYRLYSFIKKRILHG